MKTPKLTRTQETPPVPFEKSLQQNLQVLRNVYTDCPDVIFHSFLAGKTNAALIYINGLTNSQLIDQHLITPLQHDESDVNDISAFVKKNTTVSMRIELPTVNAAIERIADGYPVLLFEKSTIGYAFGLTHMEHRAIEEPLAETVIRGPRDGFIELIETNMSLLRKKIKSPQLKMKLIPIGRYTRTKVMIAYIESIANHTLVEEMTNRLQRIDVDGILESGNIEEFISDDPYSPFPQLRATERPDVVAASLLEGRVAVLVDGTPFTLIAPVTLFSLMQSPEDYYNNYMISTVIRWLHYFYTFIALLTPSLYVAILTFNQEMLPASLILSIAKSREEIPFPALIEALLMEVTFEALREAGARLPKQVGAAVSIVGALVIGQAATAAGLVSSPMVMVVAITGIASFLIPNYSTGTSIRLLRFPIMFLAGVLGLLGIMLGIIVIVVHLCTLRSFGVPYLSPISPFNLAGIKDVLFRSPIWMRNTRPRLNTDNQLRQSPGVKPGPKKGGEA